MIAEYIGTMTIDFCICNISNYRWVTGGSHWGKNGDWLSGIALSGVKLYSKYQWILNFLNATTYENKIFRDVHLEHNH